MTSCICYKLGICTLTNPSVGDVIVDYIDYITHARIGQCENSKLEITSPTLGLVGVQLPSL